MNNVNKPAIDAPAFAPIDSKPLPNLMNSQHAGKPGYYTVKPGDTVMQIGRNTNQNWRDIVKWNNLESANQIEVGQVLRVVPLDGNGVATKPPGLSHLHHCRQSHHCRHCHLQHLPLRLKTTFLGCGQAQAH